MTNYEKRGVSLVGLIIGLGNIGRRHFEAILKTGIFKKIYLFDILEIDPNSILKSVDAETIILRDLKNVPDKIDLGIIATNSTNREKIILDIFRLATIKFLIVEKILFQDLESYENFTEFTKSNRAQIYVNCPRRLMQSYKNFKELISTHKLISIEISGGNWNMASNSIHMLDLIAWLSPKKNIESFELFSSLDDAIYNNKRQGYIEVFGTFFGTLNGVEYRISCNHGNEALKVLVKTNHEEFTIDETNQSINSNIKQYELIEEKFNIDYVSNLTNIAVLQLFKDGDCDLIKLNESILLHKKLVKEIFEHQKKFIPHEAKLCLIT